MIEKVALITGASKGIGSWCAKALAKDFKVAIHYHTNKSQAEALQKELPGSEIFSCDLADPACAEQLIKEVKEKMGRIDVLVNNAGIAIDQMITFAKPADFDLLLQVNLKSVFLLSKFVSKIMIKQKSGSIINITSVVGHTGNAGQSMYAATKGAITAFTKSMALDLAPMQIRCNCVAPGFIQTDMTDSLPQAVRDMLLAKVPQKRLGRPEEVASAVRFLASDEASYITGSTIHVNGGMFTN